jgi:hypothetical protein
MAMMRPKTLKRCDMAEAAALCAARTGACIGGGQWSHDPTARIPTNPGIVPCIAIKIAAAVPNIGLHRLKSGAPKPNLRDGLGV